MPACWLARRFVRAKRAARFLAFGLTTERHRGSVLDDATTTEKTARRRR
jgi:hypothetical protein